MKTLIESLSTTILLILMVLLLMHLLNGTASTWLRSKFVSYTGDVTAPAASIAAPGTTSVPVTGGTGVAPR